MASQLRAAEVRHVEEDRVLGDGSVAEAMTPGAGSFRQMVAELERHVEPLCMPNVSLQSGRLGRSYAVLFQEATGTASVLAPWPFWCPGRIATFGHLQKEMFKLCTLKHV